MPTYAVANRLDKPFGVKAGGNCENCGTFRLYLQRDHITPRYLGGESTMDNAQFICANCHEDKSRAESSHASRTKRPRPRAVTPELRAKLGHRRGVRLTDEHRAKLRGPRGPVHSAESREKIAAARRGKRLSPETIEKIRKARIGQRLSLEHRAKLSAAHLARNQRG